jgi:hypothetical protein
MAVVGRVLPLGGVDVNVRSSMSAAESCQSPFGQTRSFVLISCDCSICLEHRSEDCMDGLIGIGAVSRCCADD